MIAIRPPSADESRLTVPQKPPSQETTVKVGQFDSGGTSYRFALKENPRGRFLRITTKSGGMTGAVIVPETGLEDFVSRLGDMAKTAPKSSRHPKVAECWFGSKRFTLTREEDAHGSFLRIVEKVGSYSNEVFVAADALEEFTIWANEMTKAAKEIALLVPTKAGQIRPVEETLKTVEMKLARKTFTLLLQKNSRGRFLRIVENQDVGYNSVIIPSEGLDEFKKLVMKIIRASKKLPE